MPYIYEFKREACWYLDVCSKANSAECYPGCIRYMEMDFLFQHSNIPKSRWYPEMLEPCEEDLDAFIYLRTIKDGAKRFVESGNNLYIWSNQCGNGKTTWALKIMQKYFNDIWSGNGFRVRGLFIHVPSFLNKIKDGISNKDPEFDLMRKQAEDVDLIIWDDIAACKLSEYDHSHLLSVIDVRCLNKLSNIYTGNISPEDIVDALGSRLSSRVCNNSTLVQLVGNDERRANVW